MNITCTFQITILAKFQEEPSANMYDDGIKRSTFDLKILPKLEFYYVYTIQGHRKV